MLELRQTARRLASNKIKVRRLAANHGTDGDDRVVALRRKQALRCGGKLPRAGDPDNIHVLEAHRERRNSLIKMAWLLLLGGIVTFAVGLTTTIHASSTGGSLVLPIIGLVVGPLAWIAALVVAARLPGLSLAHEQL